MPLSICQVDTRSLESTLQGWERDQLPFATAKALTTVAKRAQTAIRGVMQEVFDRPTAFTLNSTVVIPARKTKLSAEVRLKDRNVKGLPPTVYLQPEVSGGPRQAKNSEYAMRHKGVLPGGMFWVPGAAARMDSFGNMSRGQIIQVLSATRSFNEAGYLANRSRRKGARPNHVTGQIFVGKPNGSSQLGVYMRTTSGHLRPLMIFVNQPHYSKRLPFYDIVGQVYAANFQDEFTKALRDALILQPLLRAA